jgi:hypothetical protein
VLGTFFLSIRIQEFVAAGTALVLEDDEAVEDCDDDDEFDDDEDVVLVTGALTLLPDVDEKVEEKDEFEEL